MPGMMSWLSLFHRASNPRADELSQASGPSAKQLPKDFTNSLGMKFVWIEPGSFQMGSNDEELQRSRPVHKVKLTKGHYLQTTQVTQAQWEAVMGTNPSYQKGPDLPIVSVSWIDAQEFLQKLNAREKNILHRLPTEAEWEYACRAGGREPDVATDLDEVAWWLKNSRGIGTHPVALKKANAWGLYDMRGNVAEWVADWYGPYAAGDQIDPVGPGSSVHWAANTGTFTLKITRGGSWGDENPGRLRCSVRQYNIPSERDSGWGFRCAGTP